MTKQSFNVAMIAVAIIGLTLGCETRTNPRSDEIALAPRGPGYVFISIEDAAIDALTYSYLESHADRKRDHMYGGTIKRVAGGYSYEMIQRAGSHDPTRLVLRLHSEDVARFHAYPYLESRHLNRSNERISRGDRRTVDRIDPAHRPLYVLTPALSVRVYRGRKLPVIEVANLHDLAAIRLLARQ